MPRDAGIQAMIGERIQAPIPPRLAGTAAFSMIDVNGVSSTLASVPQATGEAVIIAAQSRAGVVKVLTADSAAVVAVTVHRPSRESVLSFLDKGTWTDRVKPMVASPERVTAVDAADGMDRAVQHARIGSELWPLFIVLALLCAVAEMIVARFWARETADASVA
jgi:hypothetical protein